MTTNERPNSPTARSVEELLLTVNQFIPADEPVSIDPRYVIEESAWPEHDPNLGYYIFRGIGREPDFNLPTSYYDMRDDSEPDYLGPYWSEIFHEALGHAARGIGSLYVAHISVEELVEKNGKPTFLLDLQTGALPLRRPAHAVLSTNPNNARAVTIEEIERIIGLVSVSAFSLLRTSVDWRALSRDVFDATFQ